MTLISSGFDKLYQAELGGLGRTNEPVILGIAGATFSLPLRFTPRQGCHPVVGVASRSVFAGFIPALELAAQVRIDVPEICSPLAKI